MSTLLTTRRTMAAFGLGCTALITACSSGGIDQEEMEANISAILAEQFPDAATPIISCPNEVTAEVGTTFECELTVEGDPTVLPVYGTVDSVEDGVANFSIEVGAAE